MRRDALSDHVTNIHPQTFGSWGQRMFGESMETTRNATLVEFEKQMSYLVEQGLVDFKAMVGPSEDTTNLDLLWTFANAVRVHRRNMKQKTSAI